jgi:hypothetical protein
VIVKNLKTARRRVDLHLTNPWTRPKKIDHGVQAPRAVAVTELHNGLVHQSALSCECASLRRAWESYEVSPCRLCSQRQTALWLTVAGHQQLLTILPPPGSDHGAGAGGIGRPGGTTAGHSPRRRSSSRPARLAASAVKPCPWATIRDQVCPCRGLCPVAVAGRSEFSFEFGQVGVEFGHSRQTQRQRRAIGPRAPKPPHLPLAVEAGQVALRPAGAEIRPLASASVAEGHADETACASAPPRWARAARQNSWFFSVAWR